MRKFVLIAASVFLLTAVIAPAGALYAQVEETDSPEISESNSGSGSSGSGSSRESAREKAEELRKKREERANEIKEKVEERKAEFKAERCEERKEQIAKLLPKLNNAGTRIKAKIDSAYGRITTFYESSNLTVANYQSLVDAVELAKANSESSMEVISSYDIEVDCDASDIGTQLDEYRTAVKALKEELKTYRDAVKELAKAIREAAESANTTETEDN